MKIPLVLKRSCASEVLGACKSRECWVHHPSLKQQDLKEARELVLLKGYLLVFMLLVRNQRMHAR